MIIQQIGNGGAFDFESVNSSFLINIGTLKKPSYILFDCGHSVFAELRGMEKDGTEIIKYIDYIYISHFDDDHDGSLKTLGYYRYFMLNLTTKLLVTPLVKELAKRLQGINSQIKFGEKIPADIFKFESNIIYQNGEERKIYRYNCIKCSHHVDGYGLVLGELPDEVLEYRSMIYISGDTKVNKYSNEIIQMMLENKQDIEEIEATEVGNNFLKEFKDSYIIFHDYSEWDAYDQQTHTCKQDFEKYYSKAIEGGIEINKYHNNKEFNKEPREIQMITDRRLRNNIRFPHPEAISTSLEYDAILYNI
jgi:hypothetical protein